MNLRNVSLMGLILSAALLRILPHPWNFTPITAMALFSGAQFRTRGSAFAVPLLALFLSDLVLGFYPSIPVTYIAFSLIVLVGMALGPHRSFRSTALATVSASVLFFLLSNLGVWMFEGMYPHTSLGLFACYSAALPFYQGTLLGDVTYTAVLFGLFRFAELRFPSLQQAPSI